MKNLALVIPVYNEEKTIQKVLEDWSIILDQSEFDLIVINDGSTDRTKDILNELKKKLLNLIVLSKDNEGHGPAVISGYEYAIKNEYNYIFQTDSDDQFYSDDFLNLWKIKNHYNNLDIILGERKKRNDPILRVFLSKIILRLILKLVFGKYVADPNIPYRLISRNFLISFLKLNPKKYIAPNIIMTLLAKKTIFVEVRHSKRSHGEIKWSLNKIIKFGIRLLIELKNFKMLIKKKIN